MNNENQPDRMRRRYYYSMLSIFPMILVFDLIYFTAHQTPELFFTFAFVHLVLFVLINLLGAYFLYRPIARDFQLGHDRPKAQKRIQRLSWYSAAWVFSLGTIYFCSMLLMIYFFSVGTGDISMDDMPPQLWLSVIPSILYIYAILPAFITWFLINDFTIDLKAKVFSVFDFMYPAGKKRIGLTLLVTFFILGFIPTLLVTLELIASSAGDAYAEFSNMTPLQAILPDRAIMVIGMVFAIVFITRSITKPIYALLQAIQQVRNGDYSAQAAITTANEIGVLTQAFNEMVAGLKEREMIRDTFGKYMTRDVANVILEQKINVAGEVRQCSILMTDIANYTTISETLSPEEVVRMLNEYFSVVVEIIQRHKGVVNKFIGDAVFAVFNVPLDDPDHAIHAVNAALEIEKITLTRTFGKDRRLVTRIGINTGRVVAGNIGSADRMEYTVIGDDVNVAARLEQLNKEFNTHILVGENTYALAKAHFNFTQLGNFQLKGKERAVNVYVINK